MPNDGVASPSSVIEDKASRGFWWQSTLFRNALPSVRRLALPRRNAGGIAVERRTAIWALITSVGDPQREAGEKDGGELHG